MNKIININKKACLKKKYNNLDNSLNNLDNSLNNLDNPLNNLDNSLNNFNTINHKFNIINQIIFINKLYLNQEYREKKELIANLNTKINSYKQQDIKRNLYNKNTLIILEDLVEKLLLSKLKCYYCKNDLYLFYLNVREKHQWTLDRIDNNKNHSNENTIIACLECNLKRRVQNKDAFLFTKQLKIKKQN